MNAFGPRLYKKGAGRSANLHHPCHKEYWEACQGYFRSPCRHFLCYLQVAAISSGGAVAQGACSRQGACATLVYVHDHPWGLCTHSSRYSTRCRPRSGLCPAGKPPIDVGMQALRLSLIRIFKTKNQNQFSIVHMSPLVQSWLKQNCPR